MNQNAKQPQPHTRPQGFVFKITILRIVMMMILIPSPIVFLLGFFPVNHQATTLTINQGDGAVRLCKKIIQDKSYNHPLLLCALLRTESLLKRTYFPGQHDISNGMTTLQFVQEMHRLSMHKIVVPEGLTVYEIKTILDNDPCVVGTFPNNISEGSLMPDTYKFACGIKSEEVVAKMQEAMSQFLSETWKLRNEKSRHLRHKEDLLILASILEKEAKKESERKTVSSVFRNRLQKNMKLQMCSTVIYAITKGKGQASFGRKLYFKDLSIESDYNTYQKPGLPPTPICNPGRDSILATLHPDDTNYLFFVSDRNGGHQFFENFNKHIQFKNQF